MALSATALVSMEEARAVLGIADSSQDAAVEAAIHRATALAETVYCHRPLKQRPITTLRVEGPCNSPYLYPDAWPINVTGTITISVNGAAQTVWRQESDGDPATFDVLAFPDHFYRAAGWAPTGRLAANVVLTYFGGYDPVPDDLKAGALELVQKLWGPLVEQRAEYASISGPGGSVQTLDGQWSGSGGAPAYAISKRTRDVFEAYRRVRVG